MSGASSELRRGNRLNGLRVGEGDEHLASRYLARKGYEPVERNYRTRYGAVHRRYVIRKTPGSTS
jgi:hypothetical protein